MIQIAQNKKTGRKVIVMSRFPYMFHVIHVALLRSCRCAAVKPASSTDPSLPLCHYGFWDSMKIAWKEQKLRKQLWKE